jgi:class 3 adenylate cyclase/dipeptidyl aminopeptidase/acylaminoacyl peptidase
VRAQTRGFLFSDLRGYTSYVEERGDRAARNLLASYRRTVRHVIDDFDGAEIRTEGDSFYVVFLSVSDAVLAGLAIQDRLAVSNEDPVRAGIGIHAGEVEDDADEGIVSSAVNVAARICAIAEPGEVLVSELVQGLTRSYLDVQFIRRGRRRLKGIRSPVIVYRVQSDGHADTRHRGKWAAARTGLVSAPALATATVLVVAGAIVGAALLREGLAGGFTPQTSSPSGAGTSMIPVDPHTSGTAFRNWEMAVVRESAAGSDIYLVDSPLDPGTRLTDNMSCYAPAWSPDGRSLAFVCQSAPKLGSVAPSSNAYVVDVGTGLSEPVPMTSFEEGPVVATDVAWEADGTLIVASGPEPIASGGRCPPHECGLTFHDPGHVEAAMVGDVFEVTVSPTSGEVLFVGLDADTLERRLYTYSHGDGARLSQLIGSDGIPGPLAWSPDGTRVAITLESRSSGNTDVYAYDLASETLAALAIGPAWESSPSWSPDGAWVAFSSDRDGTAQIWAVAVDGDGEAVQRTQGTSGYVQAAWRPAQ